jgi:hypothetical protein
MPHPPYRCKSIFPNKAEYVTAYWDTIWQQLPIRIQIACSPRKTRDVKKTVRLTERKNVFCVKCFIDDKG